MQRPDAGTLKIVVGTIVSAVFFTFGTYVHKVNKDSFSRSLFRFSSQSSSPVLDGPFSQQVARSSVQILSK